MTPDQAVLFFILHLVGDYLTQTDWMATHKTKRFTAALVHAVVYAIPFYFVFDLDVDAWFVIMLSHAIIDRYRLARYVIFIKNWVNDTSLVWKECNKTGYPNNMPAYISVWLMIIADNTMHLLVNYAAIKYV